MKPLVISKDSWHWRLVNRLTMVRYDRDELNLCKYSRLLFFCVLAVLAMGFLGGLVLLLYGMSLYLTITHGFGSYSMPLILFTAFPIALFSIIGLTNYKDKKRDEARKLYATGVYPAIREPSFLVKAYRAWKEKTCVRVSVE